MPTPNQPNNPTTDNANAINSTAPRGSGGGSMDGNPGLLSGTGGSATGSVPVNQNNPGGISAYQSSLTQADLASYAPAAFNQFGATASVDPTLMNASSYGAYTVNPDSVIGMMGGAKVPGSGNGGWGDAADTDSAAATNLQPSGNGNAGLMDQYLQYLNSSLQPGFNQQSLTLAAADRARGLGNSGAAGYDQSNLQGQQAAAFAAQAAPMVTQGFGYAQSDIAANQAAQNAARAQNSTQQQAANAQNATTANSTSAENAAYYNQAQTQNYDAYNAYNQNLLGEAEQTENARYTAWLNTLGPNSGVNASFSGAVGGASSAYDTGASQAGAPWSALSGLGAAFA